MEWLASSGTWLFGIVIALLSGWLFRSENLLILFLGFLLYVMSSTIAGYQINKASAARQGSSHSIVSSLPRGALGIGAIIMCIPAFVGYLVL